MKIPKKGYRMALVQLLVAWGAAGARSRPPHDHPVLALEADHADTPRGAVGIEAGGDPGDRGSGCHECGYTGRRRNAQWVPLPTEIKAPKRCNTEVTR